MPTLRAAVDTSIVWTALASNGGVAFAVVNAWYSSRFELIYTGGTIAKYRTELLRADYLATYRNEVEVEEFLALVGWFGVSVEAAPEDTLPMIRDVHDKIWLAASLGGMAADLITTDQDLGAALLKGRGVRLS